MYKQILLLALAASAVLQGIATAANLPSKRSNPEGIFLANCQTDGSNPTFHSEFDYYFNGQSGAQHGEFPDDRDYVTTNQFAVWEGNQICATFQSGPKPGGTVCSNISAGAAGLPTTNYAGYATLFGTTFNCYKDDNRVLWDDGSMVCRSVYYCYYA